MRYFDLGTIAIACGVAMSSGACAPPNKQVGSACRDGVCSEALGTAAPVCQVSNVEATVAVTNAGSAPGEGLHGVCLPQPLAQDDLGKVNCRMLWTLPADPPAGTPAACAERPFLSPADPPFFPSEMAGVTCLVAQISAPSSAGSNGDGWFYAATDRTCPGSGPFPEFPDGGPSLGFTEAAQPPTGVEVRLVCTEVKSPAPDGGIASSDGSACKLPSDSAKHAASVGDACSLKIVPDGGFDEREAYVETSSAECGTGACLVYHLRGDPKNVCGKSAASADCSQAAEIKDRVYCSCRCDGPAGDPGELCKCEKGFTCVDVLSDGPKGIRGSYCVRNATFTTN